MQIYRNKSCHKGDTFRELLTMWEESNYCELIDTEDRFCWIGGVGEILLYEYARFDFMPPSWNWALFSNMQLDRPNCVPWIFWARHPRQLESCVGEGILSYDKRTTSSVFLGKIENEIQRTNRSTHNWSESVELFSMPIVIGNVQHYPYTQTEYLNNVKQSKFGLVLPGYGPKCNREIEYLGLGTVPIFTAGCSLDYHNQMVEGVHYLTANSPEDVRDIVQNISENEWNELSSNGREWYNVNCSRRGSFDTTKKILEEIRRGQD